MDKAEIELLQSQKSHDVRHLMARWKRVAKAAKLVVRKLGEDAGMPVYYLEPRSPRGPAGQEIYLSTGVHGDEPGSVLGLLHWAEANIELLREIDIVLVPIFNPYGLVENTRRDSTGRDLNRSFHLTRHPLLGPWHSMLKGRRFRLALCLHEDYDAQGIYLYELSRHPGSLGQKLLDAADKIIPAEPRRTIEGRLLTSPGLLLRRRPPNMPDEPESITLHREHTDMSITFETPSNFSIYHRVRAHQAAIDTAVSWALS